MKKLNFLQFSSLYSNYADFKKLVIDPLLAIKIGNKVPDYLNETKMYYNFETIFTFLNFRYKKYYANNEDDDQNDLMKLALLQILPTLYIRTLKLTNDNIANMTLDNLLKVTTNNHNLDPDVNYATTEMSYSSTPGTNFKSGSFIIDNAKEKNINLRKDHTIRIKDVSDLLKKYKEFDDVKLSGVIYEFVNSFELSSLWSIDPVANRAQYITIQNSSDKLLRNVHVISDKAQILLSDPSLQKNASLTTENYVEKTMEPFKQELKNIDNEIITINTDIDNINNKKVETDNGIVLLKDLKEMLITNDLLLLTKQDLIETMDKRDTIVAIAGQGEIALQTVEITKRINADHDKLWSWQDITKTYQSRKWGVDDIGKQVRIDVGQKYKEFLYGIMSSEGVFVGWAPYIEGEILWNFEINLNKPTISKPGFATVKQIKADGTIAVKPNYYQIITFQIMEPPAPNTSANNYVGAWSTPKVEAEFMAIREEVKDKQFEHENKITEITMPEVLKIGAGAFDYEQLTKLTLPKAIYISDSAFEHSQLTGDFNSPLLKFIGSAAFMNSNFTSVNIISCQLVGSEAFAQSPIEQLDVSGASTIDSMAFTGIRNEKTTTVTMKNQFDNDYEKNKIFGEGNWDQITFSWL